MSLEQRPRGMGLKGAGKPVSCPAPSTMPYRHDLYRLAALSFCTPWNSIPLSSETFSQARANSSVGRARLEFNYNVGFIFFSANDRSNLCGAAIKLGRVWQADLSRLGDLYWEAKTIASVDFQTVALAWLAGITERVLRAVMALFALKVYIKPRESVMARFRLGEASRRGDLMRYTVLKQYAAAASSTLVYHAMPRRGKSFPWSLINTCSD